MNNYASFTSYLSKATQFLWVRQEFLVLLRSCRAVNKKWNSNRNRVYNRREKYAIKEGGRKEFLKYNWLQQTHKGNAGYLSLAWSTVRLCNIFMVPPSLAVNFLYFSFYTLLATTDPLSVHPECHVIPQNLPLSPSLPSLIPLFPPPPPSGN